MLGALCFHWKIWWKKKIGGDSSHKTGVIILGQGHRYWIDKAYLYEYTTEWVDWVNRGGLIEVTAPKKLGPSHKGSNNKLSCDRTFHRMG